jgi:hypothetical protein
MAAQKVSFYSFQDDHREILCEERASPHQKSSPSACLTGDQKLLVGFAADETG